MKLELTSGLVRGAYYLPSANFDRRPNPQDVEALIIHAISLPSGDFNGDDVLRFFTNSLPHQRHPWYKNIRWLRVSSHFFIRRTGRVYQFVPTLYRAWHAGQSECLGRADVNDFSIGIELEGSDQVVFTDAQYDSLLGLSRELMNIYPAIRVDHIFGHEHIAPGRKTDPGQHFDWFRYLKTLAGKC